MKIIHLCADYDRFHFHLISELNNLEMTSIPIYYQLRQTPRRLFEYNKGTIFLDSKVKYLRTPIFHMLRINISHKAVMSYIESDVDLLHAHMLFSDGFLAYKCHKQTGIPFITAIRNSDINNDWLWRIPLHLARARRIVESSAKLVFISPSYIEYFISRLGQNWREVVERKSIVLPNGISRFWHQNIYHCRPPFLTGSKVCNIITVGQVCENKNQLGVAKHLAKMAAECGMEFVYTIVGKFSHDKYSNELSNFGFVRMVGERTAEDLLDLYRSADVFILTSRHETFGLVYPEAMSQSLPIIYTKGQGIDGYTPLGKIGYPVLPASYDEFRAALLSILENYQAIAGNSKECADQFDWRKVSRKYFELYHSAISQGR